jgi:glycosyltransferase involved in cell wall biosynthesis
LQALCANRGLRVSLDLPEGAKVVGFVGRLTKDKGVEDLCEAFLGTLASLRPDASLLLVGDFEREDAVASRTVERLRASSRVRVTGFVNDVAPYYGLMDVLVLPSYREGFPNAPLEAAACGLPVVGYRASGTIDAVEDGITGTLVDVGDVRSLSEAMHAYLADAALAAQHGSAGRLRVERLFRQEVVWECWVHEYRRLASAPMHLGGAGGDPE